MKNIIYKSVLLIGGVILLNSCKDNNYDGLSSAVKPNVPDTTIYLTTFPSNIYLFLGKSVRIQNGNSIFRFVDVLENNINNSIVRLEVEYDAVSKKIIDLNTNAIPQTYQLENGLYYGIHLKELNIVDSTFQIMFIYNQYRKW